MTAWLIFNSFLNSIIADIGTMYCYLAYEPILLVNLEDTISQKIYSKKIFDLKTRIIELKLWCSELSHHLWHQWSALVLVWVLAAWLLIQFPAHTPGETEKQQKIARVPEPLHSGGIPAGNAWLLASSWFSFSHCRPFQSELANGRSLSVNSPSLSL